MKTIWVGLCLVGLCCGCDVGKVEKAVLEMRVNSLKSELEANRKTNETLLEVGTLIDSIDLNRYELIALLAEGKPPYNQYKNRLQAINNYVVDTKSRIESLDAKVNQLRDSSPDYAGVLDELSAKIRRRSIELKKLHEQFEHHLKENKVLFRSVSQHEADLVNHEDQLKAKEEELTVLEEKVQQALEEYRIAEADAYYGQAIAVEAMANQTHFAAGKKKEALREALRLYQLAFAQGKIEAKSKIAELEKKL